MGCRGEDEDDDGGTKEDDEAGAGAGLGGGQKLAIPIETLNLALSPRKRGKLPK